MTGKGSLEEQVAANLAAIDALPRFGGDLLWLTFYLCGPPERLWKVADALDARGWLNTGDWEGASLYPKLQVERTAAAIVAVAQSVQALCERHGVDILNIDADTDPDVTRSKFFTLFRSEISGGAN